MLCHVKHQVLATKPAEPRVTRPIVVHSCHCSIPVRHHRCFLPPLLRFCPGFWRSHVLCLQLCLMRLVDEVAWSDTLDQTPWRTTFDVGEPLGVGDVDQNRPRSLIIQHILYMSIPNCDICFKSYDPLVSSQSEATPAARRGMPTACGAVP